MPRAKRSDRDPATVWRTLGLYALVGEDERDLAQRFAHLQAAAPAGLLDGTDLASYRSRRLVGTVDEVREQVAGWDALGVETLVIGAGAVPFHVSGLEELELLAAATR